MNNTYVNSELKRIDYLDGWRGMAVLSLLIGHFIRPSWINIGEMGVDFFLVLSGMLMSKILFQKRVPLRTFYVRRISRVLPSFVVYVTLIYILGWVLLHTGEEKNYISTLFFLRTYLPTDVGIWDTGLPIGHLWSLNMQEHSYVLLSLITLLVFLRKREYWIILAIGLLAVLMHYYYAHMGSAAPKNFEIRTETAASFVFLSGGYFLIRHHVEPYVQGWMTVVALILGLSCFLKGAPWFSDWLLAPFLIAFAVNHLHKAPQSIHRFLTNSWLAWFGAISYSTYLWQQPFYFYFVERHLVNSWYHVPFMVLAVATGWLMFTLVENPLRQAINRRW